MNITVIFFSLIFGIGLFIIVTSSAWGNEIRKKNDFEEAMSYYGEQEEDTPPDEGFFNNVRKRGIAKAVDQADLGVSEGGFYRTGLIIAVLVAAIAYYFSGSLLVTIFLSAVSFVVYLRWLFNRRDNYRLEYEEAVATIAERMATAARLNNNIKGIIMSTSEIAPEAIKEDMLYIANSVSAGASPFQGFDLIQNRRHSKALDLLVETLKIWDKKGSTIPLSEVVDPIVVTIRQLSSTRKQVEADMTMQRWQMYIVSLAPFYFIFTQRMGSADDARFYSTFIGELIQIAAYSCSLVGLIISEKFLNDVRKLLEV